MSNRKAFTLIEILIVLAILGMVIAIGVPQLNRIFRTNLRTASVRIAGLVRIAYDNAIVRGSIHRVAFDFEENKYWLEVSRTGQLITVDDEEDSRFGFGTSRDEEEEDELEDYSPASGRYGRKSKLPSGVVFDSIENVTLDKKTTDGIAHVYFFPHGMTQDVIIRIKGDRGETGFFSIWINPINARTRLEGRYLEADQPR